MISLPNLDPNKELTYREKSRLMIFYQDNMEGHMLAAIVRYYLEQTYNLNHYHIWCISAKDRFSDKVLFYSPEYLYQQGTESFWFLNTLPDKSKLKILRDIQDAYPDPATRGKLYWYDSRPDRIPELVSANPELDGIRTETTGGHLGSRLWVELFGDSRPVPTAVRYLDDVFADDYTIYELAFYRGMELVRTRPVPTNYKFWVALFETVDCLPPDADPAERASRMKWDAFMQVQNMGNLISEHISLRTREYLKYCRPIELPHGEVALMTNARDIDMMMLDAYTLRKYPYIKYCGYYFIENKVYPEHHVHIQTVSNKQSDETVQEIADMATAYLGEHTKHAVNLVVPALKYELMFK